jgi:tRNA pseudouridine32 synthase/23S rRNA pseudouridine746 synthase
MMGMGIPIEGDQFYPQVLRGPHAPEDFGQPLQLLAHSVEFTDPLTGLAHQFTTRQELLL